MKTIGVMTDDFRFFYELVKELKGRGQPFLSLGLNDPIPSSVGVVITTESEKGMVRFHSVVADDRAKHAVDVALGRLQGGKDFACLTIGIDPGSRPGIAVLGDGCVLLTDVIASPEQVADAVANVLSCFSHSNSVVKIGHGDRTNRNRIIRAVWYSVGAVEVVDETSTTRRTQAPDVDAALSIATSSGRRILSPPEICPTQGEIRDIQRLSRIESEGRVTISADLAESVAKGDLTLQEAVEAQSRKLRR